MKEAEFLRRMGAAIRWAIDRWATALAEQFREISEKFPEKSEKIWKEKEKNLIKIGIERMPLCARYFLTSDHQSLQSMYHVSVMGTKSSGWLTNDKIFL